MAITADIVYRNIQLKDAYIKIVNIWGSKSGWNALVGVAASKEQADKKAFLYTFNVGEMINPDPYKLYELVGAKLTKSGVNWSSDEQPITVNEPVKKTRRKKVDANS